MCQVLSRAKGLLWSRNQRYRSEQESQCHWPLASHCSGETGDNQEGKRLYNLISASDRSLFIL